MRDALLAAVLLVAACGGHHAAGPAWPKSAGAMTADEYGDDGGESLAPRGQSEHVAAIERADDSTPVVADADDPPVAKIDTPDIKSDAPASGAGTVEIKIEDIEINPDDIIIVTPP